MRKVKIAIIGLNRYSHALGILPSLECLSIVGYTLPENEREKYHI